MGKVCYNTWDVVKAEIYKSAKCVIIIHKVFVKTREKFVAVTTIDRKNKA